MTKERPLVIVVGHGDRPSPARSPPLARRDAGIAPFHARAAEVGGTAKVGPRRGRAARPPPPASGSWARCSRRSAATTSLASINMVGAALGRSRTSRTQSNALRRSMVMGRLQPQTWQFRQRRRRDGWIGARSTPTQARQTSAPGELPVNPYSIARCRATVMSIRSPLDAERAGVAHRPVRIARSVSPIRPPARRGRRRGRLQGATAADTSAGAAP